MICNQTGKQQLEITYLIWVYNIEDYVGSLLLYACPMTSGWDLPSCCQGEQTIKVGVWGNRKMGRLKVAGAHRMSFAVSNCLSM